MASLAHVDVGEDVAGIGERRGFGGAYRGVEFGGNLAVERGAGRPRPSSPASTSAPLEALERIALAASTRSASLLRR